MANQVIEFARETYNVRGCEIKYAVVYVRGDLDKNTPEQVFAARVMYALDDQPNTGTYSANGQHYILNVDISQEEIRVLKSESDLLKDFFENQIVISKDKEYALEDYLAIYQEESQENFDKRLADDWIVPRDISRYFSYKTSVIIDSSIYLIKSAKIATEANGTAIFSIDAQSLVYYNGGYGLNTTNFKYLISAFTDDEGAIDLVKLPLKLADEFIKKESGLEGQLWLNLTKNFHIKHVSGIIKYKAATNSHLEGVENAVGVNGNCVIDFAAVTANFTKLGFQYNRYHFGFEGIEETSLAPYLMYYNKDIPCFYKGVQLCGYVSMNDLDEPKFNNNLLDNVIIPNKFKEKISNSLHSYSADLVDMKGSTKLFILAGPTGLGKTLTANAFAEKRNRIMIYVSAGTLGSDPAFIEKNLDSFMELASRWGADMLLDEGDVYITKRNDNDLIRNQIVAIFLTHLERYNIVMYLTTNRASSIDSAIMSRVSLFLRYRKMNFKDFKTIIRLSCDKIKLDKQPTNKEVNILAASFILKNLFTNKKINGRRINKIIEGLYGDIQAGDKRSFLAIFRERMKYSE